MIYKSKLKQWQEFKNTINNIETVKHIFSELDQSDRMLLLRFLNKKYNNGA